jgi:phosphate transport system substrate-binding protein
MGHHNEHHTRGPARRRIHWRRWLALTGLLVAGTLGLGLGAVPAAAAGSPIIGEGSSFAGPEVSQWTIDTSKAPYSLNVSYTSQSSGDGRFQFANKTVDYAVSDIPYQPYPFDTSAPNFPFIYIPVTAGGLAFMYHINGLNGTLQLSTYSACALFTGFVPYWDDKIIKADNPTLNLPHLPVHPVIRSDLAGTNFVAQEWCIHEQPALWASFVNNPAIRSLPGQVADLSATAPRSDWPIFGNAVTQSGSASAADTVSNVNNDGYITAVETAYALQRHFPVASVKNTSGQYTQPTALDVASALAYAGQQPNGVHTLNFDGVGPHVYNPSTYSYLLTPTSGWNAGKGATLSQFVNYALTLGQQKASEIGYASLGLSLEQFGVNQVKANVPGAVAPTSAEQAAYACGDLTPSQVAAGATAPVCGVVNPLNSSAGAAGAGGATAAGGGSSTGGAAGAGGAGGSGADPSVALTGSPALSTTGGNPFPAAIAGALLLALGYLGRRWVLRLRVRGERA